MSVLRTILASLVILAAGVATLARATNGFRAFTSAAARRIEVGEHPRALPPASFETARGRIIELGSLRGQWLLVDFIFTRCTSYCPVQGRGFALLQDRLARPIAEGRVTLLSISFDPAHDGPPQLAAYLRQSGSRGAGWVAARPASASDLDAVMQGFGVTAIPDGFGGYVHDAAISVVDPRGRLVAITDGDAPGVAERYVLRGLAR